MRSGHLGAALWWAGGVFLAVWLPLGLGLPGVVGAVLAVVVLAVFGVAGRREWRSVRATTADPRPAGPPPRLSEDGRRELDRIVGVLGRAGLFAPRVPEPDELEEAVADRGEPVDVAAVLPAPWEASYRHPAFRADEHLAALASDGWKGEQLPETVRAVVADLAALVDDVLEVRLDEVVLEPERGRLRHRLTLVLDGEREVLDYLGITGTDDAWEWVDEQEPLIAGEL